LAAELAASDNYGLQKNVQQNIDMGVQKFDADSQYTLERIATEVATKTVIRLQEQDLCGFHTDCMQKVFCPLTIFR
jgi:coproporphyrinogen III oxidase-like Fe-S oxidoreductase